VIGSIELEICMEMLRNRCSEMQIIAKETMLSILCEKRRAKFPSTTLGYFLLRISCLDDAFLGILELEGPPVEGQ